MKCLAADTYFSFLLAQLSCCQKYMSQKATNLIWALQPLCQIDSSTFGGKLLTFGYPCQEIVKFTSDSGILCH